MQPEDKQKLIEAVEKARRQLDEVEALLQAAVPEQEWYTRREFAAKMKLSPQTVSNYLTEGKYGRAQRRRHGQWHIHKSQLKHQ